MEAALWLESCVCRCSLLPSAAHSVGSVAGTRSGLQRWGERVTCEQGTWTQAPVPRSASGRYANDTGCLSYGRRCSRFRHCRQWPWRLSRAGTLICSSCRQQFALRVRIKEVSGEGKSTKRPLHLGTESGWRGSCPAPAAARSRPVPLLPRRRRTSPARPRPAARRGARPRRPPGRSNVSPPTEPARPCFVGQSTTVDHRSGQRITSAKRM